MSVIDLLTDIAVINGHTLLWHPQTKDWICSACKELLFTPHQQFVWLPLTTGCGEDSLGGAIAAREALNKSIKEIFNQEWV